MNRDLGLMIAALLAWGLGDGLFYHFQPLYLAQLGASPEAIGGVLGVAGLLMTVVHLPTGRLVDRWGPWGLMGAGWVVGTVGGVLMAAAPSLPWFVAGLWVYHLSLFVMVPMQAYLSLVRGRLSLARVLTLTSAAFNLGTVLGPWAGGLLAERVGLRLVYGLAAGLFVLSTLLVLRTQAHPWHDGATPKEAGAVSWSQMFQALPRRVWTFVLWAAVVSTVVYMPQPLLPNFLHQRGVSVEHIGILGTFYALGATAANAVLGAWPVAWALAASLGGQSLAAGLVWWGRSIWAYRGAYFFFGGLRASRPLTHAQAQALTPPGQRGLTYGLIETVIGLSVTVAAPVAGWLYTRWPAGLFLAPLLGLALLPALALWQRPTPSHPAPKT